MNSWAALLLNIIYTAKLPHIKRWCNLSVIFMSQNERWPDKFSKYQRNSDAIWKPYMSEFQAINKIWMLSENITCLYFKLSTKFGCYLKTVHVCISNYKQNSDAILKPYTSVFQTMLWGHPLMTSRIFENFPIPPSPSVTLNYLFYLGFH